MAQDNKYLALTEENFQREVLESPQPVLVGKLAALIKAA